ncbi:hypothetical protein BG011_000983 [Mortierella polycephala]|uniref:sn-1-specific diacylglycerol lipase n=1 Tax=Mortierella polycephala TaxID=41804 RepID=A0A9P6PLT9_9FUNG|nr:hypothetical protein BG011_000983 [Mortierella polycephala]
MNQGPQNPFDPRSTFGVDYPVGGAMPYYDITRATNEGSGTLVPITSRVDEQQAHTTEPDTTTTVMRTTVTASTTTTAVTTTAMTLSPQQPIPLGAYISISQVAISSVLKVAMISTSMSLGIARTIVSGLDKALGFAVKGVVGQNDEGSRGISPTFVTSLPFRAALLGINFSDLLVRTILETVDGSVNLALTTVQDGLDLMDTLFGPDSTSQTGETFREVWAILSREFTQTPGDGQENNGNYPALEGMRLLMAYAAIQFATSEQWETIRVRTQGRLVGECFESKDEETGSSTAWNAVGEWPEQWVRGSRGMTEEELLEEQRHLDLREQREGRSAARFSHGSTATGAQGSPNPELTNFLAASYRFSRFCSAMYGSTFLEIMGAPERFPPHDPSAPCAQPHASATAAAAAATTDHHFHCYTGTPLGSILYSSDTAATIQDGFYSPRYYLLDDVETKQIVLVLRGTKSLHDLMIDLTCDGVDLWLDHDTTPLRDAQGNSTRPRRIRKKPFKVHGGFLKAANTIASPETIGIQEKIKAALEARPGYSLLLIGHSLGAGIASVLSMLWADPATGLTPETPQFSSSNNGRSASLAAIGRTTTEDSSLPAGRRVRCYAYGTPKVMCPRMSKRAIKLVTSISYGDDVVGRLSLGSVRNIGHAMRALLAMRPPPSPRPPSPPTTPSPPSSPSMTPSSPPSSTTADDVEVIFETSVALDQLLQQEGEGVDPTQERRREERGARRQQRREKQDKTPASWSIGLEIVQKVIRWRLTKEEHLLEEFMEIRRAMHREMQKHQEKYCDDDEEYDEGETVDASKVSPVFVPAGKVLWVRPTTLEKELENVETKTHPFESVLHQFEWDHPLLKREAISQKLQQHLADDQNDNTSIRSLKSTVRSSLYAAASTVESCSSTNPADASSSVHLQPPTLHRQRSSGTVATLSSIATATSATTTSPVSLHPASQTTDKLIYRMYAVQEPEHVFDEMLFSRRMWSDHLPLTYEFILAGKHAIPVTTPDS